MSCHTRSGSTARSPTCRAATAVTAQGKHQPLQWNIGSVHRYTDSGLIPATIMRAAIGVLHALRLSRGARGVVDRDGLLLVLEPALGHVGGRGGEEARVLIF